MNFILISLEIETLIQCLFSFFSDLNLLGKMIHIFFLKFKIPRRVEIYPVLRKLYLLCHFEEKKRSFSVDSYLTS